MHKTIAISVFVLSCTVAIAQGPLLVRSNGFIRVDPRGDVPAWVNDPLPFIAHYSRACVKDDQRMADYYRWDGNNGWVLEKSVARESSPEGRIVREFHRYYDGIKSRADYEFQFNENGLLQRSIRRETDAENLPVTVIRELKYQSGLCISDESIESIAGTENRLSVMRNNLSVDGNGNITNIICEKNEEGEDYNTVIYDISAGENGIREITQSSLTGSNGRHIPVFRYDHLMRDSAEWRYRSLRSSIYGESGWSIFRKDSLVWNDGREKRWEGVLYEKDVPKSYHVSRTLFDDKGNMTDFMQLMSVSGTEQPELIGHLHFDITYESGSTAPASVISSYLLPDKTYAKSLKVVYSPEKKPSSKGITIFPNPANDHSTVYVGGTDTEFLLEVSDIKGRVVYSKKVGGENGHSIGFDTSDFTPGTYYVQVAGATFRQFAKFVVVR